MSRRKINSPLDQVRPEFRGSVLTSTRALSNDSREALFYARWKGYQKQMRAREALLEAVSLAGNTIGGVLVLAVSYYAPVIVGGLMGVR